jgi:hypothetical protein
VTWNFCHLDHFFLEWNLVGVLSVPGTLLSAERKITGVSIKKTEGLESRSHLRKIYKPINVYSMTVIP